MNTPPRRAALFLALCPACAWADSAAADGASAVDLDAVRVIGEHAATARPTAAASRLGLAREELPLTLDVLSQDDIAAQGLRNAVEIIDAIPGAMAGNLPGQPGVASMRGFSAGAVSYLIDGVRLTSSGFAARNWDSFNFERVEVLKGPASVLYGEGVLAGAINFVPKRPSLDGRSADLLLSYGRWNSARVGIGGNTPLGERTAARGDLSWSRSDGYVDDTGSQTLAFTGGLLYRPDERLELSVSLDYYHDDFDTAYFGAPLLPASVARDPTGLVRNPYGLVVDRSLRERNYNVRDGRMDATSYWLRTRLDYRLGDAWTLTNELSYYDARRRWDNTEDFTYNAATGLLDRTTAKIHHDQSVWNERLTLAYDGDLGGRRHRFAAGVEYSDTNFFNLRRFGFGSPVDPFAPDRGSFPADTAANFTDGRSDFTTGVRVAALFAESAFNLTPRWLLVTGARQERISLDRRGVDLDSGDRLRFDRDFEPTSWRVGTVYEVRANTQLYAQYSNAVLPVSTFLTVNARNAQFDLSQGEAAELGLRTSLFDGRARLTAAAYRIVQDDILTRDPLNPSLTVQGGRQSSRGVELTLSAQATQRLRVDASLAALDARFDRLAESGRDLRGNRPSNVPERTASVNAWYRFDAAPVTLGVGVRHVGDFYTDNANRFRVRSHEVADASIAYDAPSGRYTLRVRNLFDAFYADWSGYSPTQVYLGAPRSVELTYTRSF